MATWPGDCFQNARVLVVGGTSGLGAAIADAFSAEGAVVVATGATDAEVRAAERTGVETRVLDVRDDGQIVEFFKHLGSIDHLVYCAGIIRRGDEHDPSVFAEVLDINLTGAMRCASAGKDLLKESGGTITLMASMLSFFGGALVPGYAASKGGVAQLAKSLAIAYAPHGIRVNAIAPGWIDTPLTAALRADPVREASILSRTPLGRWGRPEDVAGAALFLASPLAAFMTGTILPVDGGYLAM